MTWDETAQDLVKPVPEIADSLKKELSSLSKTKMLSFEQLVKRKMDNSNLPSCVDGLFVSDKVTFVEFKRWIGRGGSGESEAMKSLASKLPEDEGLVEEMRSRLYRDKVKIMEQSVQKKAVESLMVYDRFLKDPADRVQSTRFVLVDDSGDRRIGCILDSHSGHEKGPDAKFMKRLGVKCDGKAVFYDEVMRLSPYRFARWVEKSRIRYPDQSPKQ